MPSFNFLKTSLGFFRPVRQRIIHSKIWPLLILAVQFYFILMPKRITSEEAALSARNRKKKTRLSFFRHQILLELNRQDRLIWAIDLFILKLSPSLSSIKRFMSWVAISKLLIAKPLILTSVFFLSYTEPYTCSSIGLLPPPKINRLWSQGDYLVYQNDQRVSRGRNDVYRWWQRLVIKPW